MGIILNNAILAVLTGGFVGSAYYRKAFKYWKNKNIPFIQPKFPFGTMGNPLVELEAVGVRIKNQYAELKAKGCAHGGLFNLWVPVYMPIDPEYIQNILAKDFDHFVDRGICYENEDDPSAANLFFVNGYKWKILRSKFEHIFSADHTKAIFQTLLKCGDKLKEAMGEIISNNEPIDIKHFLDLHILDVIFTCIFGLDCNTFKEPNSDLIKNVRRIFTTTNIGLFRNFMFPINPNLASLLGFRFVPKQPADFFAKLIKDVVESREKDKGIGYDFMQLLIDIRNNSQGCENLTMEELIAQVLLFFIAGYETLTTTITFCLFELSVNPHIQQRAKEEIEDILIKCDGKITYEALEAMVYMDQILYETMRKYPAVPILNRKCVLDYTIPKTDSLINKDTDVIIPVMGLHHDEQYFPNPEAFDPERFSGNKIRVNPIKYIPFGEGPRKCLGIDFAMVQMKLALTILLKNYTFSLNKKTEIPLKMSPFSVVLTTLGNIWLNVAGETKVINKAGLLNYFS